MQQPADIDHMMSLVRFQGMTDFQCDRFVLGQNGLTPWGILKQSLREVDGRRASLHQYDRTPRRKRGPYWARDRARVETELLHFEKRACEYWGILMQQIGGEDKLTPELTWQLDLEFFELRFARMALLEKASAGLVTSGTLDAILSLPRESGRRLMKLIASVDSPPAAIEAAFSEHFPVMVQAGTPRLEAAPHPCPDYESEREC